MSETRLTLKEAVSLLLDCDVDKAIEAYQYPAKIQMRARLAAVEAAMDDHGPMSGESKLREAARHARVWLSEHRHYILSLGLDMQEVDGIGDSLRAALDELGPEPAVYVCIGEDHKSAGFEPSRCPAGSCKRDRVPAWLAPPATVPVEVAEAMAAVMVDLIQSGTVARKRPDIRMHAKTALAAYRKVRS